jgi:hypothetical protein
MKKLLLASSAVALMSLSGAASAQSVLERVLNSITTDNMLPVTGTFANIAENVAVLGPTEVTVYQSGNVVLTQAEYDALVASDEGNAADYATGAVQESDAVYADWNGATLGGDGWSTNGGSTVYSTAEGAYDAVYASAYDFALAEWATYDNYNDQVLTIGDSMILNQIDGSVTNALSGMTSATANVGETVLAIDQVTVDIGDVSTTVLGAVNTGTTSLGVNSDYNQAIAGTSEAVSGKVQQLGGVANQTALVLNVASNATSVVGSVTNTFNALNGSVGNIGTTVLGAVNTGTISSGVNAASNGIVAGIVGTTTTTP